MKRKIICVIMGGGRGSRLWPLTKGRCKPAVPLGGKYRIVDIPISNCLNSGINRIYLLTQFNTASLHRHIKESYSFDPFGGGFVDILSAEQTEIGENWYQGTADAVRQNLGHFDFDDDDLFLVLSGDQLYRMDFQELIAHHDRTEADVTIASKQVPKERASELGVMRVGNDFAVKEFIEKPRDPEVIDSLVISDQLCAAIKDKCRIQHCLASMGIYLFKASVLKSALDERGADFGKEILPGLLGKVRLCSYVFEGYWEDIGTVKSFFDANLMLTNIIPEFDFYDADRKIYTRARYLPGSKIDSCSMYKTIIAEGCIISESILDHCVISVRSVIGEGSHFQNVFMMGADVFENEERILYNHERKIPHLGVGKNCRISNAIIDKNVRIGDNVIMSPEGWPDGHVKGDVYVKDGILIVVKGGVIPSGTVIRKPMYQSAEVL